MNSRNDKFFQTYGRVEKSVDEAKNIDKLIQKTLNENLINYDIILNEGNINNTLDQIFNNLKRLGVLWKDM